MKSFILYSSLFHQVCLKFNMHYNTGTVNCTRYALVLCHVFFLLLGVFYLMLSIWVIAIPGTRYAIFISAEDLTMDQVNRMCYVIIGIACTICMLAIVGCLGTLNNNKCVFLSVGILMVMLLISELVLAVFAGLFQNEIHGRITTELTQTLSRYAGDDKLDDISVAWREIQKSFKCCGVNTSLGYQNHTNVESEERGQLVTGSVWYRNYGKNQTRSWPESCCRWERNRYVSSTTSCYDMTDLHKVGCLDQVDGFIGNHFILFIVMAVLLIVVQIVAMILSFQMYKFASRLHFSTF